MISIYIYLSMCVCVYIMKRSDTQTGSKTIWINMWYVLLFPLVNHLHGCVLQCFGRNWRNITTNQIRSVMKKRRKEERKKRRKEEKKKRRKEKYSGISIGLDNMTSPYTWEEARDNRISNQISHSRGSLTRATGWQLFDSIGN